jgi:hypothetical protein
MDRAGVAASSPLGRALVITDLVARTTDRPDRGWVVAGIYLAPKVIKVGHLPLLQSP